MVNRDAVRHKIVTDRVKLIIEKLGPSKPVTKQRYGRFGLQWCCMQLRGFIESKENSIIKMKVHKQ